MTALRERFEAKKRTTALGEQGFHAVENGGVGVEIPFVKAKGAFGVVPEAAIGVTGVA